MRSSLRVLRRECEVVGSGFGVQGWDSRVFRVSRIGFICQDSCLESRVYLSGFMRIGDNLLPSLDQHLRLELEDGRDCLVWLRPVRELDRDLLSGFSFGFRVPSFGMRVSGFGFRASSFGFRVLGSRVRVLGFGSEFRVSRFVFRFPGYVFQVSSFGFRVSGFEIRVGG